MTNVRIASDCKLIHRLFEERVQTSPDAFALCERDNRLTYAQLDRRAADLARRLIGLKVRPDTVVAVALPRGIDLPVAVLATLKAGGAYVSIDPGAPADRMEQMIHDAGARVLVATEKIAACVRSRVPHIMVIDAHDSTGHGCAGPAGNAHADNLAYLIYTSGSTGRPKPVGVSHRALVNHALVMADYFNLQPGDRVLQFANMTFDAAAEEIYPTWCAGAELVLCPETIPSFHLVERMAGEHMVTVLNLPTSYWRQLADELVTTRRSLPKTVRLVIIGGEAADTRTMENWRRSVRIPVLNTYGVTEATISNTAYRVDGPLTTTTVPIGTPIPNTTLHVLDPQFQPVPIGVTGELFIGGVCVARGYHGQPGLTADRFVPDPYASVPGERLYRTGDLGRRLVDGNAEFLGRADSQLKIRGHRIEPAEVEHALTAHPGVSAAYLTTRQDPPVLTAYIVAADPARSPAPADLAAHLGQHVPAYMHPGAYVLLERLPLTPHGKVDHKALPDPEPVTTTYHPPTTGLEHQLVHIWQDILDLHPISVHDNFFHLGGHSLLAIKITSRIGDAFDVDLPVRFIFEYPVLRDMAEALGECLDALFLDGQLSS
jgi:amino acid adenylation domain-containing protein